MRLDVYSTGSHGNCYALRTEDDIILLDAGIRGDEVAKRLGHDIRMVRAVLVTHEHLDHSKGTADLARYGVNVYMSRGTKAALNLPFCQRKSYCHDITGDTHHLANIGNLRVMAFKIEHDSAEPIGFALEDKAANRRVLYATDTRTLPNIDGFDTLIIECNHIVSLVDEMVAAEPSMRYMAERVKRTHMSLEYLLGWLGRTDTQSIRQIVLIHLSNARSNEQVMVEAVQNAVPHAMVCAAHDGDEIEL